jgi:hypothetical protein
MSWTVACFCGTVFTTPPDHCPTCDAQLPADHRSGRVADAPQLPSVIALRDVSASATGFGSLERELSELNASASPR